MGKRRERDTFVAMYRKEKKREKKVSFFLSRLSLVSNDLIRYAGFFKGGGVSALDIFESIVGSDDAGQTGMKNARCTFPWPNYEGRSIFAPEMDVQFFTLANARKPRPDSSASLTIGQMNTASLTRFCRLDNSTRSGSSNYLAVANK